MREIGTLVWVVLIVIGVVGSMVSSVRRQAQAQRRPGTTGPPRYPPSRRAPAAAPAASPPQPAPAVRPEPRPPAHAPEGPRYKRPRLFGGSGELVRAVIAAEVLGKPRGLSDEQFPR